MKSCKNCGKQNEDEAEDCSECRMPFSGENETPTRPVREMIEDLVEFASFIRKFLRLPVPSAVRWVFWLLAWAAVIRSTIRHDPEDLRSCFGFPVGFYGLLPAETSIYFAMLGGWAAVILGWALYTVMSFVIVRSKGLGKFSIFYVVFCVLLALDLTGCRKLMETAAGIH